MDSFKLLAFLILLACLQLSAPVFGQSSPPERITLSEKNAPFEQVLNKIEKQVGYTHFLNDNLLRYTKNVTISVKNVPLREALDICFREQPLKYSLDNKHIRIEEKRDLFVTGKVVDEKGQPVAGATIVVKGKGTGGEVSKDSGEFRIKINDPDVLLVISCVNYATQEQRPAPNMDLVVQLKESIRELGHVAVIYNGYEDIPKERATGSFAKVNYELINRSISPNIIDRLDGVSSSLLINKNQVLGTYQSSFSIRGRSTIFANPQPLIVLDNFPYEGNINNINPEDIENVTILKDAAASSIWGALSGNGVVVISTRKGKYKQKQQLSFTSSLSSFKKPDIYYNPILSSSDYIDVEENLFNRGYYDGQAASLNHQALSPVVEILLQERDGGLSHNEAKARIDALRLVDGRSDLDKYFYRRGLNQQYSLNLSGGSTDNHYYFSAGYDKDLTGLIRNTYERVTLNMNNTHLLFKGKLELYTGFSYTGSTARNNNTGITHVNYPYVKLADANGNPLPVSYLLRQSYIDTAGGGQLLDWNYRPLDELRNADNSTRLNEYRINIGIRYRVLKGLDAHVWYQYGRGISEMQNFHSRQTYFARDLINQYTQIMARGIKRPIPMGGIQDEADTGYRSHNVRLQLDYSHRFGADHVVGAIAGAEVREVEGEIKKSRLYGYGKDAQSSEALDYTILYPLYSSPGSPAKIPYLTHDVATSDHYLSYYFNGSYRYLERYVLSAGIRKDESNIFGVNANHKGVPLWSMGAAWELSREPFYRVDWLPYLKFRVTNGYNGNVDKSLSAYTTAAIANTNSYGVPYGSITNPPNPSLRWERIHIFNAGLDFATKGNKVEGSLEFYTKDGKDLIGQSRLDPTSGNTLFKGNTAGMKGRGIDLTLNTKNIRGAICWNTAFLFSYTRDRVTSYKDTPPAITDYFNADVLTPREGRPLYSMYALKWMGLDPQNGDPQGWMNGHLSKDYKGIINSTNFDELLYKGPASPSFFGSLRNSFYWKQFGLSFTIQYKLGYYFRRSSINYFGLFTANSKGDIDYGKRWENPGDEKRTSVPSIDYQITDNSRDQFYRYSEALIERGDHLRLQDIRLSYDLSRQSFRRLPVSLIRIYLYANNIGLLWKANHRGIDPDYISDNTITGNTISGTPNSRSLAVGVKVDF